VGHIPETRDELASYFDELGVNPAAFHLFGAHADDAFVLDHRPQGWVVFYSERGGEDILSTHPNEAAACADLLTRVTEHDHVFFTLVAGPAPADQADADFAAWLQQQGAGREDLDPSDWKTDDVPWVMTGPYWRRYFVRTLAARRLEHRSA
jgi:hypothetical protein